MYTMAWKPLLFLSWLFVLLPHAASSDLVVRNLPGKSSDQTVYEVRRRLANRVKRAGTNVLLDNSTSFSLGLDGTTIFKYPFQDSDPDDDGVSASISIICTKCYIKGRASAKLTANGPFNITSAIGQAKHGFETTWHGLTDYAQNLTQTILGDAGSGLQDLDFDKLIDDVRGIDPPDVDMNLDLLFPEYNVGVNLTDLEIYMELDTVLSAGITYTFNIYQSKTIAGIALGDDLLLGAVFSIDLIFSVDGKLDISSGFHVHFDNVLTQIILFGKEASKIDFDGGRLAFLPVKIRYGNVLLKAVLRVEARIGIAFETFVDGVSIDSVGLKALKVGAGVEARVYANIAEFVTNITLAEVDLLTKTDDDDDDDDSDDTGNDNCLLSMAQAFTFGIGAAAGASVELLGNTWGPTPETEIPIFYTTLAQVCALTSTSSSSTPSATTNTTTSSHPASSTPAKRAERPPSVTSTVTSETQVATVCASAGLVNCPASLQTVTRNVVTRTLTSTVASGASVVWSTATAASVFDTVGFKDDAVTMTSSSGKPKIYTPPPPPPPPPQTSTSPASGSPSPADGDAAGEKSGSHRVSNAVIIGVSVGLGVPALLAAVGAFVYFFRRNRKASSALVPAETAIVEVTKAQSVVATYAAVRPDDDS
ncbi:hypothetical protein J3F83DRAFT_748241 [Trichoderma novae-zelandiae]